MGIIIAVLLFSFIIIFHELGHFLLAKKNGIRVDEFSLGLGPTLLGKQIGETKFSLKLLPFGGACMMGEDDADDLSEGSFNSKSVYRSPEITGVLDGYSAQEEGLQAGDVITEINGRNVHIWDDVSLYTMTHADEAPFKVEYERDGKKYTAKLEPRQLEGDAAPLLGVTSGDIVKPGIFKSVEYSIYKVKYWMNYTVDSLRMLVTGQAGLKDLSGPVGIVNAVDDMYQEAAPAGFGVVMLSMMNFGVLLTTNLGILNLLPLPALDGGRLVFLIIEAIRKKRVPPEKEGMVHFAGFALLMVLMAVVMYNDIMKLF